MRVILKRFLKFISKVFLKIEKGSILFLETTNYSGSNTRALYNYIKKNKLYDDIEIITLEELDKKNIFNKLKIKYKKNIIITTHSAIKYNKNQAIIQLWHGIPLKSMGLMDKGYANKWISEDKYIFDDMDFIISTSEFYSAIINSTIGQNYNKYKICGYPRNDYLIKNKEKFNMNIFFENFNLKNKNIFYVPTFRQGYADRVEGNRIDELINLINFNIESFNLFLLENNLNFIVKMHPFEEKYYKDKLANIKSENIYFLSNEVLEESDRDLYEWLNNSDMLITDYSSVYMDYLLTNKPILFVNTDEEEYRNSRGFLLEPYHEWTPGPKVSNFETFKNEILNLLENDNYYNTERKRLKKIMHKFNDNKNCERTWNFIKKIYLEK